MAYMDDMARKWVLDYLTDAGGFLLGRRTYEIFAAYWPTASEEEQVVAQPLNTLPKFVATITLSQPLDWQNSKVLQGDVAAAVARLKQDDGADLHVIGSSELVQSLTEHQLVDEFRLMIDPVVVSGGKRLFRDDGAFHALRLVDSPPTTTGATIATSVPTES